VPTNTYGGAKTSWETMSFAFLSNSIVKFTIRGTHFNPCATIIDIDTNGSKVGKVYNNEWFFNFRDIRESLIVMASTKDSKMNSNLL
jgi:hypothetical protein